jgi:hypothetical protein
VNYAEVGRDTKPYAGVEKFRCVAKATVSSIEIRDDIRTRYFSAAGISDAEFEDFWKGYERAHPDLSDVAAIEKNFKYMFGRPPDEKFRPGRFNTADFPALYTAKEIETAKAERLHYVSGGGGDFAYVVYSVFVTENVVDLRPREADGRVRLTDDHKPCQELAVEAKRRIGGIAWRSLRQIGGSCCAFFGIAGVAAGAIVELGVAKAPAS